MPLLSGLLPRFTGEQPFGGLRVAACLHVTAETAVLVKLLQAGGASVSLAASNPLSTQDDIAACLNSQNDIYHNGIGTPAGTSGGLGGQSPLSTGGSGGSSPRASTVHNGIAVFARSGVDRPGYYRHIAQALGDGPDLVVDDGGDLVNTLHESPAELLGRVRGGCESTTTGVLRLRRMAADGALAFPMVAANDTPAKRMMDNVAGTGQSVIDGILRATNTLLAGKTVVVAGFGPCGAGIAARAHGLGAQVIVTEVDPVRALDASLRGYRVLPMAQAAPVGEVFITATGTADVIGAAHFESMRDGAILANAGHFDVEIDVRSLAEMSLVVHQDVRPHVDAYELADGRRLLLLGEGRVVNLVAAEGHPPEVMDLAFCIVALSLAWLAGNSGKLSADVHPVPSDIDAEAAGLVLAAMGTRIDTLTGAQREYLESWRLGS